MTKGMKVVFESMRLGYESESSHTDGVWGTVYIDNFRPKDMTRRQYAGTLSALEKAGFYKPYSGDAAHEGAWGYIRLDKQESA